MYENTILNTHYVPKPAQAKDYKHITVKYFSLSVFDIVSRLGMMFSCILFCYVYVYVYVYNVYIGIPYNE